MRAFCWVLILSRGIVLQGAASVQGRAHGAAKLGGYVGVTSSREVMPLAASGQGFPGKYSANGSEVIARGLADLMRGRIQRGRMVWPCRFLGQLV